MPLNNEEAEVEQKKLKPSFLLSFVSENNARFVINDMGSGVGLYRLIADCYVLTKTCKVQNGFWQEFKNIMRNTTVGSLLKSGKTWLALLLNRLWGKCIERLLIVSSMVMFLLCIAKVIS